jgi:hypothetical protein
MEHGWTDIYVRPPAPADLKDLAISSHDIEVAVRAVLPPLGRVTTGYGTHVEPCPNVKAYGAARGIALFVEVDAGGLASAMWLDLWGVDGPEIDVLAQALSTLPRAPELLFVDWSWSRLFGADDKESWRVQLTASTSAALKGGS